MWCVVLPLLAFLEDKFILFFFLVKKKQLVFIYFMGVLKRIQGKNRDHLVDVVRFFLTIIGVIRYVLKTTFKSNKDRVMTGITKDKYIMKL